MDAKYTNLNEEHMQWEKPVLYTEDWMNTASAAITVLTEVEDGSGS